MKEGGELLRLGVLLSGRGSNFVAIAESIRAGRLKGVGDCGGDCERGRGRGLKAAEELGLAHEVFVSKGRKRAEHDADVIAVPEGARCGAGLPGGLYAVAFAGVYRGVSESNSEYSSVAAAGVSGTGCAGAGV